MAHALKDPPEPHSMSVAASHNGLPHIDGFPVPVVVGHVCDAGTYRVSSIAARLNEGSICVSQQDDVCYSVATSIPACHVGDPGSIPDNDIDF